MLPDTPFYLGPEFDFGSFIIKLTGSTQFPSATGSYICEDWNISRGTEKVERRDEVGLPSSYRYTPSHVTGDATLQIATTQSAMPAIGCSFAGTFNRTIGAETFKVVDVGEPRSNTTDVKVKIKFDKLVS